MFCFSREVEREREGEKRDEVDDNVIGRRKKTQKKKLTGPDRVRRRQARQPRLGGQPRALDRHARQLRPVAETVGVLPLAVAQVEHERRRAAAEAHAERREGARPDGHGVLERKVRVERALRLAGERRGPGPGLEGRGALGSRQPLAGRRGEGPCAALELVEDLEELALGHGLGGAGLEVVKVLLV